MGVRRLSPQPLTSYDLEVQNFFARMHMYKVVRAAPVQDVLQQGTLYQAQLDGVKAVVDNIYNESRLLIRTIRDTKGSFNPVYPVPEVDPPVRFKPVTWLPPSPVRRVKTSAYKSKGCQATISGGIGPRLNGGNIQLGPIPLIISPRPLPYPRPRPWPPFPPLPPPGPINVWVEAMEKVYSTSYAYYWRFVQIYTTPPLDAYDLFTMAYYCLNHWNLVYQMYRHVHTDENACRVFCNETTRTLEATLC